MNNRSRHTIAYLLFSALVLIMCIGFPIPAFAANGKGVVYWGINGSQLLLGASEADVLNAGAASAAEYNTTQSVPWSGNKSKINTVKFVSVIEPTTTKEWFKSFSALKTITGIDNLDTSGVTDMTSMFNGCKGLTSLDLSQLNTSSVENMTSMFSGCSGLTSLTLSSSTSKFNTSNVTDMSSMFEKCSKLETLDLSQLDTSKVKNMTSMFSGCSGLKSLTLSSPNSKFNTSDEADMTSMFNGCKGLTSLDLSQLDTRKVKNMSSMFSGCSGLTSLDLSQLDTSSVENMSSMFNGCKGLTSLDLSKLNTSNVTDMSSMFSGCSGLTSLTLSSSNSSLFNTCSVTDMSSMFYNCSKLETLDLSQLDTSSVDNMSSMFSGCSGLTSLTLSSSNSSLFNTCSVTDMSSMFYNCSKLETLDLSQLNTSEVKRNMSKMFMNCSGLKSLTLSSSTSNLMCNVTDMSSMFYNCQKLTSLDLSSFNTSNVTDMSSMFEQCIALTELDLSKFDTSNVKTMKNMFSGCIGLTSLNVSSFNTSNVTNMEAMFGLNEKALAIYANGCSKLTELDLSNFDTSKVTTMKNMFYKCEKLESLNLSQNFNTESVTTMQNMFIDCSSLTTLDLSNFDTSQVTTMMQMFKNCTSLKELDFSKFPNFNTSNVTDMSHMFYSCIGLKSLDVSNFDTSSVTNMTYMFYNCNSLELLDLSSFDTSQVTTMISMFQSCSSLKELNLSNFKTDNVTLMSRMFDGCSALEELNVSSFNTEKVTTMQAMFSNCTSLKKLDLSNFNIEKVRGDDKSNKDIMLNMLSNCTSLETLDMSGDHFYINSWYAFDRASSMLLKDTALRTIKMPPESRAYDLPKKFGLPEGNIYWNGNFDVSGKATYSDIYGRTLRWHNVCYGPWEKKDEQHKHTCEVCGKILTDWEPHDWDWKKVDDETHKRTCTKCGEEESGDHAWAEETGWKSDSDTHSRTCTTCNGTVIEAHKWGAWEDISSVDGSEHKFSRSCKTCYYEETVAHKWGFWKDVEDGKTHKRTCYDESCPEKQPAEQPAEQTGDHIWGDWADAGDGTYKRTCVICKAEESCNHRWSNWTEAEDGTHKRTCKYCSAEEIKNHEWSWEDAKDGNTHKRTCVICNKAEENEDHKWSGWTDTEDGNTHKRICVLCKAEDNKDHTWDYVMDQDVKKYKHICTTCGREEIVNHTWGDWEDAKDGKNHKRTCTKCGVEDASKNHTWGNWTDAGDGTHKRNCTTCNAEERIAHVGNWTDVGGGKHKRTCTTTTCKAVEIEDHTWGQWSKTDDNTHKRTCTKCSSEDESRTHDWQELKRIEATHYAQGYIISRCKDCGGTKTEDIDKIDHSFGNNWEEYNKEQHKRKCSGCEVVEYRDHNWDAGVITAATHTTEGKRKHTCQDCGATKTEDIPKTIAHTASDWIIDVPATCTTKGSKHTQCTICDQILEIEEIPKTGHTFDEPKTYAATCVTDGYTYHVCTVCEFSEKVADIEAKGHTYGDIITRPATCELDGYTYHICTVCKHTETVENLKATGHTFGGWERNDDKQHRRTCTCGVVEYEDHAWDETKAIIAATHTTEGQIKYTCSVCNAPKFEVIPKTTEHVFGAWEAFNETQYKRTCECGEVQIEDHAWNDGEIIAEATHLTEGEIKYTCTICGTSKTGRIPKITEHSFGDWKAIDETQHEHTCECGETDSQNHVWNEVEIIANATHTTEGQIKYTCSVCKKWKIEKIPKTTEHNFGAWEKYNETQYKRTCECGEVQYDDHAWDKGKIITDATHQKAGEIEYTCTICGTSKREEIPKTAQHTFGDWIDAGETQHTRICECGEEDPQAHAWSKWYKNDDKSQHERECVLCGRTETADHVWNENVITKQPTCNETGERIYTCTICGTIETEILPITNEHTYGEIMTRPVTCEVAGYTYHSCTVCKHTEKIEDFKATGHKESAWITDAEADCVTAGSRHKECETCGKLLKTEVIPATGHTFGDWEKHDGTQHQRTCACGKVEYQEHAWGEWEMLDDSRERVCSVCGEVDHSIHRWDDGEIITDATHLTEGEIKYICQGCGTTKPEVIPKTAEHSFGDWIDAGETQHTRICECGEEDHQAHAWSKWRIKDDESRVRECVLCGREETTIHTWDNDGEGVITKQPTCKETGVKTYTCTICGTIETEILPITNEHTYGEIMTRPVTCEVAGYTYHSCTVCGHTEKIEDFEETGHKESAWIIDAEADCVTAGSRHKECETCAKLLETEVIPVTGHTPSENWETNDHERWKVCTVCGTVIEKIPHTLGELIVDKAPGCTEPGRGHRICSGCGYEEKETIEALGHSWESDYTADKEPTCTTDGSKSIHCQNCDEVKDHEVIPATGHTPSENWETDEHERWKVCTVCGEKINRTSHTFGELIIDITPTCTKPGRGYRICSGCGYKEYEAIKAIGHLWESDYTVDEPTCITDGSKSIHCQNCDKVKDHEVIPATGHTPSENWETDDHERWRVCTVCGAVIEKIPHTLGELIVDKAPSCTEPGRGHRICSGCGYEEKETIEARGHSWESDYTVDKEPTCTTDGSKSIHCQNCDEVKDRKVIPATGHTWNPDQADKAPTCTETGIGHRECAVCGHVEIFEIEATGHSWDTEYTVDAEPTCTTEGSKSIHCHDCDVTKDSESIPAAGHTWNPDQVDKAPTGTETGIGHRECAVCGHVEIFEIEAADNPVVDYEYTVEGKYKFYLSHDEREFKAEDLIQHLFRTPIYKDGTKGKSVEITDLSGIDFGGQTPKSVFTQSAPVFIGKIAATITDEFGTHDLKPEEMGTAYIAVKGDIDLSGEVNAGDASYILVYAACTGSGLAVDLYTGDIEDDHIEEFVYFLGDVDGESEDHGKTTARGEADSQVDAVDASNILNYAAQVGSLGYKNVKWENILYPNVPLHTALIAGLE